jgi:hypothetical protein
MNALKPLEREAFGRAQRHVDLEQWLAPALVLVLVDVERRSADLAELPGPQARSATRQPCLA